MLAGIDIGVRWGERDRNRAEWPRGCSEENRVRNMKPSPGAGSGDVKGKKRKIKGKNI